MPAELDGASDATLRLVVGVGASAGGLQAFKELLDAMPSDEGMAFVLVQHLDPEHESLLAELLEPRTEMPVVEAVDGARIAANTVYTIRPGTTLTVRAGHLVVGPPEARRGLRHPVDDLFHSLAEEHGHRAAGVVLSGAGSDGSAGLRAIKAGGGLAIAQEPSTCGQAGMPESAITTKAVDLVLTLPEIPAALERFVRLTERAAPADPFEAPAEADARPASGTDERLLTDEYLERLAALIEAQVGFDVRVYKPPTLRRRLVRRMLLSGVEDPDAYLEHLRHEAAERQALVRDLLISVTEFFRDATTFDALREMVVRPTVAAAESGDSLRIWVPGCATGEEPYSIAMEFLDEIDARGVELRLQVFATDVDTSALATARSGLYLTSIAERVSESRLRKYFEASDEAGYRVRRRLRDTVSFAEHDLTKDPPFSRMDLVSCRNVLIYLTPDAQRHVLGMLHFALVPDGHLLLGTSETTGARRDRFRTVSKTHRIYCKLGDSRGLARPPFRPRGGGGDEAGDEHTPGASSSRPSGKDLARRSVLAAWVPPTVVVGADGAVLFLHGELAPFLKFPQGDQPELSLHAMLRPAIATRARGALYKCRREGHEIVAVVVPEAAGRPDVRITAKLAADLGEDVVMLTFEELSGTERRAGSRATPEDPEQEAVIQQLEKELQATREDLQSAVEELETSNEELRTSNEESMSMNEELQSANEELEATTEELRSLNEELTTVNTQLREKVEQLEQAHDDLANFFASTKVATLFLDEHLVIQQMTPSAAELLRLGSDGVGRHVPDIARELLQHDLARQSYEVLEHLTPRTRRLRTEEGRWYVRDVRPYRTEARRIDGVVVTFSDVTDVERANLELRSRTERLELAWEAASGGIFEHRVPGDDSTFVSPQLARLLGYEGGEPPGGARFASWFLEQVHPHERGEVGAAYDAFLAGRTETFQAELRLQHREGDHLAVRTIAKGLDRAEDGRVLRVLGMVLDVSDLKRYEQGLRESESRFREMSDGLPLIVWVHDASGEQEYVNQTFYDYFGVTPEEVEAGVWRSLMHPEDAPAYTQAFYEALRDRTALHARVRVRRADGEWRTIESWGRPRFSPDGEFRGLVGTSADLTDQSRMEEELRANEAHFRAVAESLPQLVWSAGDDGTVDYYNSRVELYGGIRKEPSGAYSWEPVVHAEDLPATLRAWREAVARGELYEQEHRVQMRDGSYRWHLSRAYPLPTSRGTRWFGSATDIQDLKEVAESLAEKSAVLEHEDLRKEMFLATLGHELRNPLAAIEHALQAVQRGLRQPEEALPLLGRHVGQMSVLLDDLLEVSRVTRGKVALALSPTDLRPVVEAAVESVQPMLEEKHQELTVRVPERLTAEVDGVRIEQVLVNLLTNASRYSPARTDIRLTATVHDEAVVLRVQDQGRGLGPEALRTIFEPFTQADPGSGGLGIGLALVKGLVELHGGDVVVESEGVGLGACFTVRLPRGSGEPVARAPEPEEEPSLDGRRVLVVDDQRDAADTLALLLASCGAETRVVYGGEAAVQEVLEWGPDIAVVDLGLPDLSGFEVAERVRAEGAGLRMIALTGFGDAAALERASAAGFEERLVKPVDFDELLRCLARPSREAREDRAEER